MFRVLIPMNYLYSVSVLILVKKGLACSDILSVDPPLMSPAVAEGSSLLSRGKIHKEGTRGFCCLSD